MGRLIDITGKKFGCLTVLRQNGIKSNRHIMWLCRCKCKKIVVVDGAHLRNGNTKSCGCFRTDFMLKHGYARGGHRRSKEYKIWNSMIQRCHNSNSKSFIRHGARGIKVCKRWRGINGFKNFHSDMGDRPTSRHSLDRRNNDGNYSKRNCRWATKTVQALNSRIPSNNSSGIKGVSYNKRRSRFESYVTISKRKIHLGWFKNLEGATKARKIAEKEYYEPILQQAG